MPTQKQIAANRRNAQHSTGPCTAAGKSVSRFNALKHGINAKEQIMFGETEEDLLHLTAEYQEQYQPANPTERLLVDTLINNEWRLRRLRCTEAELWQSESELVILRKLDEREAQDEDEEPREPVDVTAGETFTQGLKSFIHVQRVINHCERNLHRALKELQRLQALNPQPQSQPQLCPQPQSAPPEPAQTKPTSESPASFCQTPEPTPTKLPSSAPAQSSSLQTDPTPPLQP
jgi:hypothetical protein